LTLSARLAPEDRGAGKRIDADEGQPLMVIDKISRRLGGSVAVDASSFGARRAPSSA
jgi:hypothetical protein